MNHNALREEFDEFNAHMKFTSPAEAEIIAAWWLSKLDAYLSGVREKVGKMKENNICTCERKICHCGKFPTAKEADAYNRGLQDAKSLLSKEDTPQ